MAGDQNRCEEQYPPVLITLPYFEIICYELLFLY